MSITAIIPAYNEQATIANVIIVLKQVDIINRILVVSDGSTDSTAKIARELGVDVLELDCNKGKGGAMKAGLDNCSDDIILFLDADLIGLKKHHVLNLLEPVICNNIDMTIGIFSNGRLLTDLAQRIAPYLSGQRAVRRNIISCISNIDISRFGVEIVLTRYAWKQKARTATVQLDDMTHCMKEEKLGLLKGFAERLKMYWDIAKGLKPDRIK